MTQIVDAVFQNGSFHVLRPEDIPLREGENVRLTFESERGHEDILALAADVYSGLSAQDIDEVEEIALDRIEFFQSEK